MAEEGEYCARSVDNFASDAADIAKSIGGGPVSAEKEHLYKRKKIRLTSDL